MRSVPLKRIVDPARPIMYGIVLPGPNQIEGPMIVKGGDVKPGRLEPSRLCRTTSSIEAGYTRSRLREGDVIVAIRGGIGDVELVPASIASANITQDVARVSCGPDADARFIRYAMTSAPVQADVLRRTTGATIRGLNIEDLREVAIPFPPWLCQTTVADFLDGETGRIGKLLLAKRRQLAMLAERREAVAELFLVDADAEHRRGSSLAWAESIPAHWREVKLGFVSRLGSGHTPGRDHPEWWLDGRIPWITTGEVAQMRSDRIEQIFETREMISELGLANSSATVRPKGTVVLCRTAASAGYSAIMGRDMATSQDFATWTCGPMLRPRYLLLCLRAMRGDLLDRLAMGSTHKTIYMPDIESIRIPLPPLDEQERIVERTWQQLRAIDRAVDAIERHILLLRERNQALITAAVTGQLEIAEAS